MTCIWRCRRIAVSAKSKYKYVTVEMDDCSPHLAREELFYFGYAGSAGWTTGCRL